MKTLLSNNTDWTRDRQAIEQQWQQPLDRVTECRRNLEDAWNRLFAEVPRPTTELAQAERDFRAQASGKPFVQFFIGSSYYERLVENLSALGWAEPHQLRERIQQAWRQQWEYWGSNSVSAFTRSLASQHARPADAPASVAAALLRPLEDCSALFGEDFHYQLEQPAEKGPAPMPVTISQLAGEHLEAGRILQDRAKFWSEDPALLRTVSELPPPSRFRFWKRGARAAPEAASAAHATIPPLTLDKIPANTALRLQIRDWRNHCIWDALRLREADAAMERQVADVEAAVQECRRRCDEAQPPGPVSSVDWDQLKLPELIRESQAMIQDLRQLAAQIQQAVR
ncbi:MAG: hypothetical protein ABSH14_04830 [Verrucomicrobiia bacterium]|jgi:hypothetical protein